MARYSAMEILLRFTIAVIQPCHEYPALQLQAKVDVAKRRKRHRNRSNLIATITPPKPKCSHPVRNRARVPGCISFISDPNTV